MGEGIRTHVGPGPGVDHSLAGRAYAMGMGSMLIRFFLLSDSFGELSREVVSHGEPAGARGHKVNVP